MKTCLTLAIAALALTGSTVKSAEPAPTPLYQGVGDQPEHERNDIKKGILRMAGMRETIYGDGTLAETDEVPDWKDTVNIDLTYQNLFWIADMERKLGSKTLYNEMHSYGYSDLIDDISDMLDPEGDERTIEIVDGFRGKYIQLTDRGWESFIISGREEAAIREVMWKLAYDLYTGNGETKYKHLYNYAYATGGSKVQPEYYRLFVIDYLYDRGFLNYNRFWNNNPPHEDERVMKLTDDGHVWFANNIGGENLVHKGTRWDWKWLTKNHKNFKDGIITLGTLHAGGKDYFNQGHFVYNFPGYSPQNFPSNVYASFNFLEALGFIELVNDNGDPSINDYRIADVYNTYTPYRL